MIVLLAMVGYQEFESRVLVPKVTDALCGCRPPPSSVALLVGGKLGGIVGALLALPWAAAVQMFIEELRVDLPGDDTDNSALKQRDCQSGTGVCETKRRRLTGRGRHGGHPNRRPGSGSRRLDRKVPRVPMTDGKKD